MARKLDRQTIDSMTADTVSDTMNKYVTALKSVTVSISRIQEQLNKYDAARVLEQTKDMMKGMGLFTDAQLETITDFNKLRGVISELIDKSESLSKLQGNQKVRYEMRARRIDAMQGSTVRKELLKAAALEQAAKAQAKANGMTDEMFDALYKGVPSLKDFLHGVGDNVSAMQKYRKETGKLIESVEAQVKGFFTFGNAVNLAKKALVGSYEEMTRLSSQGMLGAFVEINLMSKKLLMSTEEFQKAVQDNRQYINTLGGGIEGIRKFGNQVGDIQKQIMYLGKNAGPAAIKLNELANKAGLVIGKDDLYAENTSKLINHFKKFNAMYGDTAESYADLMFGQQQEEHVQTRLNNLKGKDLVNLQDELRERTEMLKNLGLSNDQIKEFNSRLENLYDPKKNNYTQQVKEGVMFQAQIGEMTRNLLTAKGKTPEETSQFRQTGQDLSKFRKELNEIARSTTLSPRDRALLFARPDIQEAIRAYNKAWGMISQNESSLGSMTTNIFGQEAGALGSAVDKFGFEQNTAITQAKSMQGMSPDQVKQVQSNNNQLQDSQGAQAKALEAQTVAIQTVTNLMHDPLVKALESLVAGVGAAAGAATGFSWAVGRASLALAGEGGLLGSVGAVGKGLLKFGKLAGIIGFAVEGFKAFGAESDYKSGKISEKERNKELGDAAGSAAGMAIGGVLGSLIAPGIGTWIGGVGGSFLGGWLGNLAGSKFGRDNVTGKQVERPQQATEAQMPKATQPVPAEEPKGMSKSDLENWRKSYLENQLSKNGIDSIKEKAAFMAQMDHETMGFKKMTETGSGAQYNGNRVLGNFFPGDGERFKGRGYIQLTGRSNYKKYGDMVGVDLVHNPELAARPDIAAKVAIAYWRDRKVHGKTLSEQAQEGNFDMVTLGINGGYNGKLDRDVKYKKYLAAYQDTNGQNITTAVKSPTANSKLPEGAVPKQQTAMTDVQTQKVKPTTENDMNKINQPQQQSLASVAYDKVKGWFSGDKSKREDSGKIVQGKPENQNAPQTGTMAPDTGAPPKQATVQPQPVQPAQPQTKVASTTQPPKVEKQTVNVPPEVTAETVSKLASVNVQNPNSPILVQLDQITLDRLASMYVVDRVADATYDRTPSASPKNTEVNDSAATMSGKSASAMMMGMIDQDAAKPQLQQINPTTVAPASPKPEAKPAEVPAQTIVNPIKETSDQLAELKKQTDILAAIAANTAHTRTANPSAYQKDRSTVLNGTS